MKFIKRIVWVLGLLIVAAGALMLVPTLREKVIWRTDQARMQLRYAFNPPERDVFIPKATVEQAAMETLTAMAPGTATPMPQESATATPEKVLQTATPTQMPTPLPPSIVLKGVKYFDQNNRWNYCAPANLAMALSYWGWQGTRDDVGKWVKPFDKDKNVMPYELADYVQQQTGLAVVQRSGGTPALIKKMVAAGFPVLIEKGAIMTDLSGRDSWMGHYQVITGYDDPAGKFIAQDSFYKADYPDPYDVFISGWRAFNHIFLIVYPPDQEQTVMKLLGDAADEKTAFENALQTASAEIYKTSGNDQFFAWYNRGTNLVAMQDFSGAAAAYDEAFKLYALLPLKTRPYRITWYETGPFFAYFYTGRYQDVVDLATQTIGSTDEPYLEESYYWRAMALNALGNQPKAVEDLKTSLQYHPGFGPSLALMSKLGVNP